MQHELKNNIVKHGDFDMIERKDSLDDDLFIFDNLDGISVSKSPIKLENPMFAVCVNGSAHMQVNLNDYNIPKDCLVTLMPDHILHGYSNSDDFKGLFLGVSNTFAEEMVPDIHSVLPVIMNFRESPVVQLTEEESKSIQEAHKLLWKVIRKPNSPYKKKIAHAMMQALLYEALDVYKSRYNFNITKRSRNEEIFYNFFTLVERDFKIDRSVLYYADKLCITPKHLSAVVKAVSGHTAGDWIDKYVVLAAKVMLRSSSYTIQEISSDLNFSNQSFFGKYFKQHVGMSPSDFRLQDV
jgi:AraC family transcriptional regulator, transcriptional activator of pobA